LHEEFPDAIEKMSNGHAYDLKSNIFDRLPNIFHENKPDDGNDYIKILGRVDSQRAYRYIRRDYIIDVASLDQYKVIFSEADGAAGTIGEPIPARILGIPSTEGPGVGLTESFLSVGLFASKEEANCCLRYCKTRFLRSLVSVLKTTQHVTPSVFKYVPLQDFTPNSDIDWDQPISGIDKQLYDKYGISDDEITFIEKYVKEMK
jgi:type II restriction enzyme